jgi:hypothetical protein
VVVPVTVVEFKVALVRTDEGISIHVGELLSLTGDQEDHDVTLLVGHHPESISPDAA